MQHDHKILEDLSRLVTGVAGGAAQLKRDVEALVRQKVEHALRGMNFVTREEFEVVREMAEKARAENDALKRRVEAIEKK